MNISLKEYAILCMDVYFPRVEFDKPHIIKDTLENDKINGYYINSPLKSKHNWRKLEEMGPEPNGFYAAYYIKNDLRSRGVIVYRGSDDYFDFVHHDLKIAAGEWPTAKLNAIDFYTFIKDTYSPDFLAFAGHSLGGGLAQLVGVEVNNKNKNLQKYPVICFNAPQMGYLIHDTKEGYPQSAIDEKNKTFEDNIKYERKVESDCEENFAATLGIKGSTRAFLNDFNNKAVICSNNQYINGYTKLKNIYKFYDGSLSDLSVIYKNICKYKDITKTINFGQPAFNTIYDLLEIKSNENILANDLKFELTLNEYKNKYDYIFNFNSYFDLVHVCGKPLGHQITIDIDKPEYIKFWEDTGEGHRFITDYNYKKSQAYKARLKCELRACLTLSNEYQNYQNIRKNNKAKYFDFSNLLKQKITTYRQNNAIQHSLSKVDLSIPEIINVITGLKFNMPNYETEKIDELIYMAKTQHVMTNIGNVIQNESMLKNISIGANYKQAQHELNKFINKNKYNLDESSERLEFIINELGMMINKYDMTS